jgi:environmental stress-induced protein Ves
MVAVTTLNPDGYGRSPWKNGGGIFIDIADAYRDDAPVRDWDSLLWRFGRTAIITPAPFSYLPDIARMQMVVKGHGLSLKAADREFDERQPFVSVRFPGELDIVTHLDAGPVEVVNLMANRTAAEIDLLAITQPGVMSLAKGTHLIYAAAGESLVRVDGTAYRLIDDSTLRLDLTTAAQLSLVSGLVVVGSIFSK